MIFNKNIIIDKEFIEIRSNDGNVFYWDRNEWLEDPDLILSIVTCAVLVSTDFDNFIH